VTVVTHDSSPKKRGPHTARRRLLHVVQQARRENEGCGRAAPIAVQIHEVATRLDRTFITPLDREDIYRLAQELDTVVDLIDGTARRAAMFHLRDIRPNAVRLAGILQEAVNELEQSVRDVKDRRSVAGHTVAIKKFEEAGDSAYAQAVGALFEGTPDAIDVIKWKDLYDTLEEALDRCQSASIVLESISLKHS
jgi:uncharacterized protein Yka (UPF0111/DUF47 family)